MNDCRSTELVTCKGPLSIHTVVMYVRCIAAINYIEGYYSEGYYKLPNDIYIYTLYLLTFGQILTVISANPSNTKEEIHHDDLLDPPCVWLVKLVYSTR